MHYAITITCPCKVLSLKMHCCEGISEEADCCNALWISMKKKHAKYQNPQFLVTCGSCLPMQVLAGTESREIQNDTQDNTTKKVEGT